jgi:hypothetical protein
VITINLIKNDPIVRRTAQVQRAQEKYAGSPKAKARFARFRASHLEELRVSDRARKAAERVINPEKLNERNRYWRRENYEFALECGRRAGAKWRSTNGLLRKYGLTPEDLIELIAAQVGQCAICLRPLEGGHKQHIDHDREKPGTCRGVLCNRCNLGIGLLRHDPEALERAANYLRNGGTKW